MEDKIGFKVDSTCIVVDANLLIEISEQISKLNDRLQHIYDHLGLKS